MYKKILALLLCATLLFLSGCSGETNSSVASSSSEASTTVTPEPTPTPKPTLTPTPTPVPTPSPTLEPVWEDIDVSTLPQSLLDFFAQFASAYGNPVYDPELDNAKEYDAEQAGDGSSNIIASIVTDLPCVVFEQYPVIAPEYRWSGPDPVGWSPYGTCAIFDGPSVDWIVTNIFNVTEEDMDSMVRQGEERQLFKRLEGEDGGYTYYTPIGGIGGPMRHEEFLWAQSDGTNYRLVYEEYDDRTPGEPIGTYYAEMEDKVIEGEHYWSMHLHTAEIPEDMVLSEPEPEATPTPFVYSDTVGDTTSTSAGTWQDAYEDFVMSGKYLESGDRMRGYDQTFPHFFGLHDMNDDDTPELLICNGFNGRDLRGYYVFTYDGDNVIYCGSTLTDSYIAPSYPGMFSSVGMTGSYLENEYIGVYFEVTYLNYYSLVDNQVTKEQVYILGTPIDSDERVYIYKTDNEDLYNASQGAAKQFRTLSKEDLESQGWDALLDLYE